MSNLDAGVSAAEMLTALPEDTLQDAINVLQGSADAKHALSREAEGRRDLDITGTRRAAAIHHQRQADQRAAVARVLQAELDGRVED